MKKAIYAYGSSIFLLMLIVGVTYAAFTDKASVLGSTFSVGSSDIKLLSNVSGTVDVNNLVNEKVGVAFNNISANWSEDYLVKIYNNSPTSIVLTTNANYETANDPDSLRSIIFVEPIEWVDGNSDGVVDALELGVSLGRKTIIKWKTEGFNLGQVDAGAVKAMVLRFSTDTVGSTKQGTSAKYDFEFNSTGL